ncbi:hypothetical protein OFQ49_04890 [Brachyspira hyodysenteriae]|nr:hypothetical protein [Brachyspira hyodysenteriae]MCZ9938618.1 hypothetical protein [Brachyspira hyodysenteriae]MDA0054242.1 hypothetical protein [Brachyspira hyodysenteriae]
MYHSRFKGSHYESGLKYGKLLAKNNINPLEKLKSQMKEKILLINACLYIIIFP